MAYHAFYLDDDGVGYTCKGCGRKVPMVQHDSKGRHIPGDTEPHDETHHQSVSRFPNDECVPGG